MKSQNRKRNVPVDGSQENHGVPTVESSTPTTDVSPSDIQEKTEDGSSTSKLLDPYEVLEEEAKRWLVVKNSSFTTYSIRHFANLPVPNDLKGDWTSETVAKRAIYTYLHKKMKPDTNAYTASVLREARRINDKNKRNAKSN